MPRQRRAVWGPVVVEESARVEWAFHALESMSLDLEWVEKTRMRARIPFGAVYGAHDNIEHRGRERPKVDVVAGGQLGWVERANLPNEASPCLGQCLVLVAVYSVRIRWLIRQRPPLAECTCDEDRSGTRARSRVWLDNWVTTILGICVQAAVSRSSLYAST